MEPEVFTEQQKFKNKIFWWVLIPAMLFSYGVTVPGVFGEDATGAIIALIIMTLVLFSTLAPGTPSFLAIPRIKQSKA